MRRLRTGRLPEGMDEEEKKKRGLQGSDELGRRIKEYKT